MSRMMWAENRAVKMEMNSYQRELMRMDSFKGGRKNDQDISGDWLGITGGKMEG
jgi:hypothetical protein